MYNNNWKEIERKFLVDSVPALVAYCPSSRIFQGYVRIESDGTEERLRKEVYSDGSVEFTRTIKSGGDMVRREDSIVITEEEFERDWGKTEGRVLEKRRYRIPEGEKKIELDIYASSLLGLVVAEVEFTSASEASKYVVPTWFGKEVTEDKRYKNKRLAVDGFPR